jgi:hypothetical protein
LTLSFDHFELRSQNSRWVQIYHRIHSSTPTQKSKYGFLYLTLSITHFIVCFVQMHLTHKCTIQYVDT